MFTQSISFPAPLTLVFSFCDVIENLSVVEARYFAYYFRVRIKLIFEISDIKLVQFGAVLPYKLEVGGFIPQGVVRVFY
jgi:hypothetical protein